MKKTVLMLLVTSAAFAYNSQGYEKIAYKSVTVVNSKKNNLQPEMVSLKLDVRSTSSEFPIVVNYTQAKDLCEYKKTLLMYSGYDIKTREHIRTYEIQINVSSNRHGKACSFVIQPEKTSTIQESARVTIL